MWTAGRIAARRVLRRKEGAQDERLGEALSEQLDQMKGLAMKVGQIVSYMDIPVPASVQDKLARLQRGVRGMSEAATREALTAALGEDWASRFDAFEIEPFAAASIGQVHRATFEGRPIALKLRYPEVADTMHSDLGTMRRIASLASLAAAVDGQAIVDELAARLAEECDYEREARYQSLFRCAFKDDPDLVIPEVHGSLVTESTLGTTWCDGVPLEVACEASAAIRSRYARALVRFSYRSLFQLGAIQADPHPGNFLVLPGPRLCLLDFGCVGRLSGEKIAAYKQIAMAVLAQDSRKVADLLGRAGFATRDGSADSLVGFADLMLEQFREGAADWASIDPREQLARAMELARDNPVVEVPPEFVLLGRVFGTLGGLVLHYKPDINLFGLIGPYLV